MEENLINACKRNLSIVIPCYNEERTLKKCVEKVLKIRDDSLNLQIIIVDDCSTDKSLSIAHELEKNYAEVTVLFHKKNQGKGAALRTGFRRATGDFVAVQDADLEYNPIDLKKLLVPLINDDADVVFGSRFLSGGAHRVLYFWHSFANRFLTLLSNMFTDLNLTDMESCYKVFRRDVIENMEIKEKRFGVEPEIVARVAHMRVRIYEISISYHGRTYAEGKKITAKDGLRALYCIFRYNANKAPVPIQFSIYLFIGGFAAIINLLSFLMMLSLGLSVTPSAPIAFVIAAIVNYLLCILILFRHKAKWSSTAEILIYCTVVCAVAVLDLGTTKLFLALGNSPAVAKSMATALALILNFIGRRFFVFPEQPSGPWQPQVKVKNEK